MTHDCFCRISKYCLRLSLLEITVDIRPLLDLIVHFIDKEAHTLPHICFLTFL